MSKIKIIATPSGQAPEEIRKAWIGLIIPLAAEDNEPRVGVGVLGGRVSESNVGGYRVSGQKAIAALEEHNPEAAAWWNTYASWVKNGELVFGRQYCELVWGECLDGQICRSFRWDH